MVERKKKCIFLSKHYRTEAQLFIRFSVILIEACITEQYKIPCHKTSGENPEGPESPVSSLGYGMDRTDRSTTFHCRMCHTGPESLHRGRRRKLDSERVLGDTARFRD